MPQIVPLKVQVVAFTKFEPPADVPWETDVDGGQALAEFAGRACYQSWTKPNPATATNAGYLQHILEVGHLSVLEHGTVSVYLSGISRALTHELIRHRHFSYSQLSQRYVPERDAAMVEPEVIAEDPELHQLFLDATDAALAAYTKLLEGLEKTFSEVGNATLRRKQARQAARSVLPNATETRIVVTRQLPCVAPLHRHARHRARRRRDPRVRDRLPARDEGRRAQRVRRFHDLEPARRHRGRLQPDGQRRLTGVQELAMGFFGTYRFHAGAWAAVDPEDNPAGAEPWLWVDVHDSDFATIRYAPSGSGTGLAYLNVTPRVFFDDPKASEPTDPVREADGLAQWRAGLAVRGSTDRFPTGADVIARLLAGDDDPELDDLDDDAEVFAELKAIRLLTTLALSLPPDLADLRWPVPPSSVVDN